MGQVSASSTVLINAEPDTVLAAVADYQAMRPKILSPQYSGYQVLEGGQGAGTVASWKLQATKSRSRDVKANVDVAGHTVIEKDANSSRVTNCTVAPAGPGASVTVKTAWLVDTVGNKGAHTEIQAIKILTPEVTTWVLDRAVQAFGGAGVSQDTPLAALWAGARTLHLADGPDEVHEASLGRREIKKYLV